ncbi:MAG TPA: hypothetical protein VF219_08990 [Vicinamibacterales bacterium]
MATKAQANRAARRNKTNARGAKAPKRAKRKARTVAAGSCFVLMPFKEPFETYYRAIIEPAVTSAGLMSVRGDSIFRPSPIMADIWQMIQDASVLVAEMTEKNANVFYELGLAHALGKPVILISETITDVPFDLQALRVILYDKNNPEWGEKLRSGITDYLRDTLTDTSSAVPSMFRKVVKSQAPAEPELSARIAALEQQVGSLRSTSFRTIMNVDEIKRMAIPEIEARIRQTRSRAELIDFVAHVLKYRPIPRDILEMILMSLYPMNEVQRVLREAKSAPV